MSRRRALMIGKAKIAEASGVGYAYWTDGVSGKIPSVTVYGEYQQDGTPTPTAPIAVTFAKPSLMVANKNAIPYPYADGLYKETNGITYQVIGDGPIRVTGTSTGSGSFVLNRSVYYSSNPRINYATPDGMYFNPLALVHGSSLGYVNTMVYPQVERRQNAISIVDSKVNLAHYSGYGILAFDGEYLSKRVKPSTQYRLTFRAICIGDTEVSSTGRLLVGFIVGSVGYCYKNVDHWATNGEYFDVSATFTTPSTIDSSFTIKAYSQEGFSGNGATVYNKFRFSEVLLVESKTLTTTEYVKPFADGGSVQAPTLRAVGDVRDEWDAVTGKGIRRIGEVVFTGSEKWTVYSNATYGNSYYTRVTGAAYGFQMSICSHCQNKDNSMTTNLFGVYSDNTKSDYKYFRPPNSNVTTVDEFKAWLTSQNDAGNPVRMWYVLATPEEFTTAPSRLYQPKGIGQIMQTDSGVQAQIKAQYLQK